MQRRNDDELLLARLMRTVSYFIVQGWAKETPPPEELWPLPNDPKREVRKATKEDLLNLFVALGGREIPNTPESS